MIVLFLLRRLDCENGITTYCETIMRGLKNQGYGIAVVTGPITVTAATQSRLNSMMGQSVEWRVLPTIGSFRMLYRSVKIVLGLMRRQNIGVICPQGFKMLPLAKCLSVLTKKRIVAVFHGGAASHVGRPGSFKEKILYSSVTRLFMADKFISMSRETTQFMTATCGIDSKRVVSIPYGIDTAYFRPPIEVERRIARTRYQIGEASIVCVIAARVSDDKGQNWVVDAVRSLRRTQPELAIVCLFAGSTHAGADIIARAHQDEQDRVAFRFLGFVDRDQIRETYWAADIVLLPSSIEGFAITIVEAMACGCIAVRTPAGGCADQIIDGATGFVVPFNDSSAIARRISQLADPQRRLSMSASARAHIVANFSEPAMITHSAETLRAASDGK